MSLSAGWSIARSALSVAADQTAVATRNIANADTPLAARKTANVVTAPGGGLRLASITRTSNQALFDNMLSASSASSGRQSVVEALDRLDVTLNDPELDASPAALAGKLGDALQLYSSRPQDIAGGQAVLNAADNLANSLNAGSRTVFEVRRDADAALSDLVARMTTQLSRFEAVNAQVVSGSRTGRDITDELQARDIILAALAEDIGIRTMSRSDNDLVIYTDSGVTLFETTPRNVSFEPTPNLAPGVIGNGVIIDGVPVTGDGAVMPVAAGRLEGLIKVRDDITVTYQRQLDEIARGLIESFAESDQSAAALPDLAGLFTHAGGPAMPASGALNDGLAVSISVNANVDPAKGGDISLLRDGAISDPGNPAYIYNASGAAGFSDRLQQLISGLDEARAFDPAANGAQSASVGGFASSSVAWLAETRKTAADEADYRSALFERTADSLSRETGINLDEEMINLLDLERSYQASSRLISTIDNMFGALFAAAG